MHFSYDLEKTLTDKERRAAKVLEKFRDVVANRDKNLALRNFYENRKEVEDSKLFEILNKMPKGAIHHIHTTAGPPVDVYVEMTRDPMVFYNEREKLFKVFPKPKEQIEEGYV